MSQLTLIGDDGPGYVVGVPVAEVVITVLGVPQPAGSKSAFAVTRKGPGGQRIPTGQINVRDSGTKASAARHKSWRLQVQEAAEQVIEDMGLQRLDGPLEVWTTFTMLRPKAHYLVGGALSAEGRRTPFPAGKPDGPKLDRAIHDSLTDAGLYRDDCLIARWHGCKEWAGDVRCGDVLATPGVVIRVRELS